MFQPMNAFQIRNFFDDMNDQDLYYLIPFFKLLKDVITLIIPSSMMYDQSMNGGTNSSTLSHSPSPTSMVRRSSTRSRKKTAMRRNHPNANAALKRNTYRYRFDRNVSRTHSHSPV